MNLREYLRLDVLNATYARRVYCVCRRIQAHPSVREVGDCSNACEHIFSTSTRCFRIGIGVHAEVSCRLSWYVTRRNALLDLSAPLNLVIKACYERAGQVKLHILRLWHAFMSWKPYTLLHICVATFAPR